MPLLRVGIEEVVTSYISPNNGAGPLWCYGSPVIVRDGFDVFVSIPETNPARDGLCKTRWQLFHRDETGWSLQHKGEQDDEREPCPLVRLPGGRLVLSVNPLADPASPGRKGRCIPHLLVFSTADPTKPPVPILPRWDKDYPSFSEHSYRGIGVDLKNDTVLLLNIDGHTGYAWSVMDRTGQWVRQGEFSFPIRACYPQVGIQGGAAHILAVGDIVEANPTWRAFKREKTGRDWDYDFRRLFYTWAEDITRTDFQPSVEIASHESTAGHIRNFDMWIDAGGAAHVLYATKNIWHDFMRDHFFPGTPIVSTLEYRVIKAGRVIEARTLSTHTKDESDTASANEDSGISYAGAAFHVDPVGRLRVVYTEGNTGLLLHQVHPWADDAPMQLDLQHPLTSFFIPSPRMGSDLSNIIDMFGSGTEPNQLRYARISLQDAVS